MEDDRLLDRLEELVEAVDAMPGPEGETARELVDALYRVHRAALGHLEAAVGPQVDELRAAHPAIAWLFDAYGVGLDDVDAAEHALEAIRPYIESHGGAVEVLDVTDGVVRVRMAGACAGCTASSITLQHGVEEALSAGLPGFAGLEVEDDDAAPHPPPGAPLLPLAGGDNA